MSSSRNSTYEARGSADNSLEVAQTHSRETNVECGAVVKPRCDKSVDKSSSSSESERARDDKIKPITELLTHSRNTINNFRCMMRCSIIMTVHFL